MRQSKIVPVLAVVFAATAALLSFKLLAVHFDGATALGILEIGCGDSSATGSDCAAVLASPYSYWPPKQAHEPEGTPHVPVALIGLLYYSMLTVWLIGVGRASYERRLWHLLPGVLTTLGLFGSANFVAIMLTRIDEWCLWCMVTHALNVLLAVCLVLMWPRRTAQPAESTATETAPSLTGVSLHPSGRLIMTTLLAVWLASFGLVQYYGRAARTKQAMALKTGYDQCVATIKDIAGDGGALLAMWLRGDEKEIAVRSDDPVRWPNQTSRQNGSADPSANRPLEAVVFSDFECPVCKRFARFLDEKVQPLFDGRLRLVFKHYPLHRECNPMTQTQLHKHACDGAAMVEAARALGGSDAFWKTHDFVFSQQSRLKLGKLTAEDVATALGLDARSFAEAMEATVVRERIAEDATVAKRSGVRSTPALFVSGRQVRFPARDDIRFWDKLADRYWRDLNETRPPSTVLAKQSETTPAAVP